MNDNNDVVAKILVRVYLVNGSVNNHTYDPPENGQELEHLTTDIINRASLLDRGKTGHISFRNPFIIYTPDNVLCVEITSIGIKEFATYLKKIQTKLGYIK